MYRNIGSRNRLDFTVIGPALNIAPRLGNLVKGVNRPILLSKSFVGMVVCKHRLQNLSPTLLRGLSQPIIAFAFPPDDERRRHLNAVERVKGIEPSS